MAKNALTNLKKIHTLNGSHNGMFLPMSLSQNGLSPYQQLGAVIGSPAIKNFKTIHQNVVRDNSRSRIIQTPIQLSTNQSYSRGNSNEN